MVKIVIEDHVEFQVEEEDMRHIYKLLKQIAVSARTVSPEKECKAEEPCEECKL